MKNMGGRGVLLLTRNSMKDFCPERPTGARDRSSRPKKDFSPVYRQPRGERHREEAPIAFRRRSRSKANRRIRAARLPSASRKLSFVKAFPSLHPVREED